MPITWAEHPLPASGGHSSIHDAAWSPTLHLWVVVCDEGVVLTSPDGVAWTRRAVPEANHWYAVEWSPVGGIGTGQGAFCAVAANGTHRVMTSPDGITWTPQSGTTPQKQWWAIAYIPTYGGIWSAVGAAIPSAAMWSNYGDFWADGSYSDGGAGTVQYSGVCAGNLPGGGTLGLVAVALSSTTGVYIAYSAEGKFWTPRPHPPVQFFSPNSSWGNHSNIAFSPELRTWVAPACIQHSPKRYAPLYSSAAPDGTGAGLFWTQATLPAAADITTDFFGVCWNPITQRFLGIGSQPWISGAPGKSLWTSPNGIDWSCEVIDLSLTYPAPALIFTNGPTILVTGWGEDSILVGTVTSEDGLTPNVGVGGGGTLVTFTHQP